MSTATTSEITKRPGRCGGNACIRDTRITVWGLAAYRQLGMADDQILDVVQDLTRADLEAAWDYVARNRDEIERVIRENESDEE